MSSCRSRRDLLSQERLVANTLLEAPCVWVLGSSKFGLHPRSDGLQPNTCTSLFVRSGTNCLHIAIQTKTGHVVPTLVRFPALRFQGASRAIAVESQIDFHLLAMASNLLEMASNLLTSRHLCEHLKRALGTQNQSDPCEHLWVSQATATLRLPRRGPRLRGPSRMRSP